MLSTRPHHDSTHDSCREVALARRAVAPPTVQLDPAPTPANQLRSMPSGPDIYPWLLDR